MTRIDGTPAHRVVLLEEREIKLELDNEVAAADLDGLLEGSDAGRSLRHPVVLGATYFDTKDLRLLRSGITLRRRMGGTDEGWHLKLPDDAADLRTEIQLPLGADDNAIPAEIEQIVADWATGGDLHPVLRMRTERAVMEITGENGALLAEVADDRVHTVRLGDLAFMRWREIEIEQHGDDSTVLERLEQLLCSRGARRSRHASKAARALGRRGAKGAATKRRRDPVTMRLRAQIAELIACEADVRARRDDAVHRMRVATRRLGSLFRTFRTAAVEPTGHLRDELAWLGDRLGAERDAEVIAARIDDDLENLPSGDSLEPVIASLSSHGGGAKEEAHQSLIAAIDSVRFRSLLDDLVNLAMSAPIRARSRRPRWLRQRLAKAVRKTERLVALAASLDSPERDAALHEVRKQTKHVRYAAETIEPRFGKKARRLARSFESFQEILGEHHDAVVTRGVFHDARARAGLDEGGSSYDLLIAREDARAAKADSEFVKAWKWARRHGSHRWMAR